MNAKANTLKYHLVDKLKCLLAVLLILMGAWANYYYDEYLLLYRVLGLLVVLAVVMWLMYTTNAGQRTWEFTKSARLELKRVVWPSRQETIQATLVVLAMVFVMSILLWLLDSVLFKAMLLITGG